jgi:hypothetical protein
MSVASGRNAKKLPDDSGDATAVNDLRDDINETSLAVARSLQTRRCDRRWLPDSAGCIAADLRVYKTRKKALLKTLLRLEISRKNIYLAPMTLDFQNRRSVAILSSGNANERLKVSTQNAVAVRSMQIPTSIDQIWGTPDFLGGAHEAAYKALWIDIANDIEPSNVIEWLWIIDILELSWEIRRLRRFKREVSERNFYVTSGSDFDQALGQYKKLNELESSAEARRNAVFREIEWRRSALAGRIRKGSHRGARERAHSSAATA